jgi:hypothetical protein
MNAFFVALPTPGVLSYFTDNLGYIYGMLEVKSAGIPWRRLGALHTLRATLFS